MKPSTAIAVFFAGIIAISAWSLKQAKADATLASPTALASVTNLHISSVMLDYDGQSATIYYKFRDASNNVRDGGSQTVPFPNPTPAALGNIRIAAAKTLCGYSSGSIGAITPVAVGTAIP